MSLTGNNILGGASGQATGYDIDQSLRFNRPDAPYLEKTFSASNRKTWTWSGWFKLADPSVADGSVGNRRFFGTNTGNSDSTTLEIGLNPDNKLFVSGWDNNFRITTALYRDPGSWYHCTIVFDSTDSTANDRLKLYINGERITDLDTNFTITQDADYGVNQAGAHYVGYGGTGAGNAYCMDGYLAEIHFIDGTALTPASFGETNSATNQWVPIEVTGMTYGTNGFYQKYSATELANSFTDSAEGYVINANGNVHTDTSVKKIGTASAEFDGTDDYISIGPSSEFEFSATDSFTLEGWVRFKSIPGSGPYYMFSLAGIRVSWDQNYDYWYCIAGTNDGTWSNTPSVDTWYHLAVVGDGTNVKLYIDGTERISFAQAGTVGSSTATAYFGTYDGDLFDFDGYMDEVRLSSSARYTSSFTPSTTAFTTDANTSLLLHMDGSDGGTVFTDSSGYDGPRHAITAVGNAANSRAQAKIGTSSIYFDGTGDALTIPGSSDFQFGTGNFTIECWHYAVGTPGTNDGIISWYEDHTSGPVIEMTGAQYQLYEFGNTGTHQDVSAFTTGQWNHIALVRNSAVTKFYLNGSETYSVSDTQNYDSVMGGEVNIGRFYSSGLDMDGYLDEIRISDSARYTSAFTPSTTAFTADANTMLLIHSDFDGGLGADSSGNKNDFSATNLVATDQVLDSPTNNFATLNPLIKATETPVFSEGNLRCVSSGSTRGYFVPATIPVSSGKWYAEFCVTSTDLGFIIGAMPVNLNTGSGYLGGGAGQGSGYYGTNGQAYNYDNGGTQDTTPATAANGDIIGVALDMDDSSGKLYIYRNNTILDTVVSGDSFTNYNLKTVNDYWTFALGNNAAWNIVANFGQDSSFAGAKTAQGNGGVGEDFYYTPPTGYKFLATKSLDDPAIALPTDHFNATLWTGDTSTYSDTRAITGVGHAPDLVWLKNRDYGSSHDLFDSVRGGNENLHSNTTDAEVTNIDGGWINSFDSDGFTLKIGGGGTSEWYDNLHDDKIIGWAWKAGGTASSNGDGSITSSVSANTAAGFSIVSYTGTGSTATVGHGIQKPELIIVKSRDSAEEWPVGATAVSSNWSDYLALDKDRAKLDDDRPFNDTAPTSSVFTVGSYDGTNKSGDDFIAYCFASIEGYSKVGTFTGNNDAANNTFVYTGFKPAFLLVKNITTAGQYWTIWDNKRDPYNMSNHILEPNDSRVESNVSNNTSVDLLSNGFKPKNNNNQCGGGPTLFLYYAVASSPFKTSNAR